MPLELDLVSGVVVINCLSEVFRVFAEELHAGHSFQVDRRDEMGYHRRPLTLLLSVLEVVKNVVAVGDGR